MDNSSPQSKFQSLSDTDLLTEPQNDTGSFFIIDKTGDVYTYIINILKVFVFPLFIFSKLVKPSPGVVSYYIIAVFFIYFAIIAVIAYLLFTNVLIKDGTTQSIELICSIMIWFVRLFLIIVSAIL